MSIYAASMPAIDSRQVLWQNVLALMHAQWHEENLNRLARAAGIGPATCMRLKQQQTSVGLEVVDKIAEAFNVAAWQLLVPGADASNMPALLPVSEAERKFYERVVQAAKDLKN